MVNINGPIVSVIIATYNRAKSLGTAIESVLKQSYHNIEIIVVDDGSTDQTKVVVQSYFKDSRVKYVFQENRGNNVYPMNKGAALGKGEYIAILDDDDFWSDHEKLKKQVEFLQKNKEYVLVGSGAIKIGQNGKEIVRYLPPEKDEDIREKILVSSMFVHISVLFRKDAWEKVGGYDAEFGGAADWDLWMKLGTVGKFYNIQEFFVTFTDHNPRNLGYVEARHKKLEWLKINIKLKQKHSWNYPHYAKGIIFCWLDFFYFLLPFRRKLWSVMFKFRNLVFNDFKYNG